MSMEVYFYVRMREKKCGKILVCMMEWEEWQRKGKLLTLIVNETFGVEQLMDPHIGNSTFRPKGEI